MKCHGLGRGGTVGSQGMTTLKNETIEPVLLVQLGTVP